MNSQYEIKSMIKEKASLLQKYDQYLFLKKFRKHIADNIKSKKQTKEIFIEHKKPFSFSPSHALRKCEGQKFFLTKTGSKISIMITNNNNSNAMPTTDRQGVSNRDMVGITTPKQTFFSMDLNLEKKNNSVGLTKS